MMWYVDCMTILRCRTILDEVVRRRTILDEVVRRRTILDEVARSLHRYRTVSLDGAQCRVTSYDIARSS